MLSFLLLLFPTIFGFGLNWVRNNNNQNTVVTKKTFPTGLPQNVFFDNDCKPEGASLYTFHLWEVLESGLHVYVAPIASLSPSEFNAQPCNQYLCWDVPLQFNDVQFPPSFSADPLFAARVFYIRMNQYPNVDLAVCLSPTFSYEMSSSRVQVSQASDLFSDRVYPGSTHRIFVEGAYGGIPDTTNISVTLTNVDNAYNGQGAPPRPAPIAVTSEFPAPKLNEEFLLLQVPDNITTDEWAIQVRGSVNSVQGRRNSLYFNVQSKPTYQTTFVEPTAATRATAGDRIPFTWSTVGLPTAGSSTGKQLIQLRRAGNVLGSDVLAVWEQSSLDLSTQQNRIPYGVAGASQDPDNWTPLYAELFGLCTNCEGAGTTVVARSEPFYVAAGADDIYLARVNCPSTTAWTGYRALLSGEECQVTVKSAASETRTVALSLRSDVLETVDLGSVDIVSGESTVTVTVPTSGRQGWYQLTVDATTSLGVVSLVDTDAAFCPTDLPVGETCSQSNIAGCEPITTCALDAGAKGKFATTLAGAIVHTMKFQWQGTRCSTQDATDYLEMGLTYTNTMRGGSEEVNMEVWLNREESGGASVRHQVLSSGPDMLVLELTTSTLVPIEGGNGQLKAVQFSGSLQINPSHSSARIPFGPVTVAPSDVPSSSANDPCFQYSTLVEDTYDLIEDKDVDGGADATRTATLAVVVAAAAAASSATAAL